VEDRSRERQSASEMEADISPEGREEHEVKKFKNINFPFLRALRGEIWFS
jgi:hypothetical protein